MEKTKGFTLIELLVVIAIIGILSAVVLASLNTARAKGADAAIKANLANVRAQGAIWYDDNGHYGDDTADCSAVGTIFADATVASAIDAAELASGAGNSATCYADDGDVAAGTAASSWAISVPLKAASPDSWCVDSTGVSEVGTAGLVDDLAVCQ